MIKYLLTALFLSISPLLFAVGRDTTIHSNGNPIITHVYTADPAATVYKGKVYLYTGHDEAPAGHNGYVMHNWLCFSSEDMVT